MLLNFLLVTNLLILSNLHLLLNSLILSHFPLPPNLVVHPKLPLIHNLLKWCIFFLFKYRSVPRTFLPIFNADLYFLVFYFWLSASFEFERTKSGLFSCESIGTIPPTFPCSPVGHWPSYWVPSQSAGPGCCLGWRGNWHPPLPCSSSDDPRSGNKLFIFFQWQEFLCFCTNGYTKKKYQSGKCGFDFQIVKLNLSAFVMCKISYFSK